MADSEQTFVNILVFLSAICVVALLIAGFYEIFKKPTPKETTDGVVISRQLKGFALLQLAPIVIMGVSVLGVIIKRGIQDAGAAVLAGVGK
jgi:hypothetical protein